MSVIKPVVRSVMSSAVQSVMGISRRYIHTLDSAGGMYYAFSSNIAPAGNWSFSYVGTLEAANNVIFGETAAANNRIVIQSTGNVQIAFGGTSSDLTSAEALSYLDGKIHTVSGSISGTTVTLKIDGNTIGAPTNAGSPSFATVGRSNTVYSDGSSLSLKIWDAGTLAHQWSFNTDLSSAAVRDEVGSNDLTATNMTSADSEPFTQKSGGWENAYWPNLLTYSEDLTNAAWSKTRSSAADADTMQEDATASATHQINGSVNVKNGTQYSFSVDLTAVDREYARLQLGGATFDTAPRGDIRLTDGNEDLSLRLDSWSASPLGANSYRLTVTATAIADGAALPTVLMKIGSGGGDAVYSGDGASQLSMSRMQFNEGGIKPYRKTTSIPGRRLEPA